MNHLEYREETYLLTNRFVDFANPNHSKIASIGSHGEAIFLDTEDAELQALSIEFSQQLATQNKSHSVEQIFAEARTFSNSKMNNTAFTLDAKETEIVKIDGQEQALTVYRLEEMIKQKKGRSEHHALFIGFLLGEYIKQNAITDICVYNKKYQRKNDRLAQHWVLGKQNKTLFLIDPIRNRQYNLSDYLSYIQASAIYTRAVIDSLLEQAGLKRPASVTEDRKQVIAPQLTPSQRLQIELDNVNALNVDEILKCLAEGAALDTQGRYFGYSVVHVATVTNDVDLLNFLVSVGAQPNLESKIRGRSPLFYAQSPEIIECLVKHGANYLQEDSLGYKAYQSACQNSSDVRATKQLFFKLALEDSNLDQLNKSFYKDCAPEQIKFLNDLSQFIKQQIERLQSNCSKQKGVADKTSLYEQLDAKINLAMNNDSLTLNELIDFSNQAATISHHRRFRTRNKATALLTWGVFTIEADSWKAYKQFVEQQEKIGIVDLHKTLENSLVAPGSLPCQSMNGEEIKGYEAYRAHYLPN